MGSNRFCCRISTAGPFAVLFSKQTFVEGIFVPKLQGQHGLDKQLPKLFMVFPFFYFHKLGTKMQSFEHSLQKKQNGVVLETISNLNHFPNGFVETAVGQG